MFPAPFRLFYGALALLCLSFLFGATPIKKALMTTDATLPPMNEKAVSGWAWRTCAENTIS
jgi:hypothetical protein